MKAKYFKRAVFIAICILGLISFSSCRSTAGSCGLADVTTNQQQLQQVDVL